jgi:hypothetical protein
VGCLRPSIWAAIKQNNSWQRITISIYIVKLNFSKIVAYNGTISKFLNMVAVHIECQWHLPHMLIWHIFSCHCLFEDNEQDLIYFTSWHIFLLIWPKTLWGVGNTGPYFPDYNNVTNVPLEMCQTLGNSDQLSELMWSLDPLDQPKSH